ncbi:MAG: NAD(P)/FAD-dependent oxidoreductase [Chloroflexi bacterium]|nr:NAD(P)/FAD-dependent oxidoreductase [Chloroflexota bacterium]MCI0574793.1 NAD(P)/FAD-dependent oxidoreductase [Chloroflexota bacterium]MCI0649814.1 NAD(P)/FAD-dependent oxidoreductase [Chloroflexota bacterium]
MKQTIRILGAGPSGLSAAINLARAGYDVHVFEKRGDAGKRFHGDLQGLENWSNDRNVLDDLRRMNVEINFDCDPMLKLVITNGYRRRESRYTRPLCYLVKRGAFPGSLDQGLKAQALAAGVNIHFKQTLPEEEADIVATGPISREIFAVDKGIVFQTSCEDTNVFLVNDEAAYKGYSYLLITRGYGCLCTCLFDRFTELDDCYEASQRFFLDTIPFDIQDPHPVSGIGCFSTQNVYQRGKAMIVGEAAGIQDLMWGFGIRTAIESGYLAACCLIENRDYAQAAQAFFESKLKATLAGRFLWEMARLGNYAIVVNDTVNRKAKGSFNLSYFYNFGSLQKLLYPLALRFIRKRYPNLRV